MHYTIVSANLNPTAAAESPFGSTAPTTIEYLFIIVISQTLIRIRNSHSVNGTRRFTRVSHLIGFVDPVPVTHAYFLDIIPKKFVDSPETPSNNNVTYFQIIPEAAKLVFFFYRNTKGVK